MSLQGMSAQGTIIARSADPNWPDASPVGGVVSFVDIAQLKKLTPPPLTRKELETTTHNASDDQWIVGIRRHGTMTALVNFVPQDGTQDHLTGLQKAWFDGTRNIFQLTYPDSISSHGTQWLFSGFITNVAPVADVDSVLEATIGIRPTGLHKWIAAA